MASNDHLSPWLTISSSVESMNSIHKGRYMTTWVGQTCPLSPFS